MVKSLLLLALLGGLLPGAAGAETPQDVVTRFGLIGHWAQDCHASATRGNWHVEYSASPARTVLRRMFRDDEAWVATIDKAEAKDADTLAIYEFYGETWDGEARSVKNYTLLFTAGHSKYQSIQSVYGDGTTFIKDGKMSETGEKSPVIEKCSD